MKQFKIFAVMVLFAAFIFTACENTTNPTNPQVPNAPTNLMATSSSSTEVSVKWTPSTSESDPLFAGYVLTVTGGGAMAPIALTAAQNPYKVAGLQEGTVYTFSLKAKFTNDEVSDAATVQWSPAARFIDNENDAPIRVYETASTYGSGLVVYNPDTQKPKSAKVSDGASWTLGLYTKNSEIAIGSPKSLSYTYGTQPGTVEIGNIFTGVNSLDEVYGSQALSSMTFSEKKIDLTQYTSNIVIVLRYHMTGQTDWNYAKVLVKYTSGAFLQGIADNRYVECIVSHQLVTGVAYSRIISAYNNNYNK